MDTHTDPRIVEYYERGAGWSHRYPANAEGQFLVALAGKTTITLGIKHMLEGHGYKLVKVPDPEMTEHSGSWRGEPV